MTAALAAVTLVWGGDLLPARFAHKFLHVQWTFVAEQRPQLLIGQHCSGGMVPTVDKQLVVHQSHTMAVVHIFVGVAAVQWLDRQAIRLMPAVECHSPRVFQQPAGQHQVLFGTGHQPACRALFQQLLLNQFLVLQQSGEDSRAAVIGCGVNLAVAASLMASEIRGVISRQPSLPASVIASAGCEGQPHGILFAADCKTVGGDETQRCQGTTI